MRGDQPGGDRAEPAPGRCRARRRSAGRAPAAAAPSSGAVTSRVSAARSPTRRDARGQRLAEVGEQDRSVRASRQRRRGALRRRPSRARSPGPRAAAAATVVPQRLASISASASSGRQVSRQISWNVPSWSGRCCVGTPRDAEQGQPVQQAAARQVVRLAQVEVVAPWAAPRAAAAAGAAGREVPLRAGPSASRRGTSPSRSPTTSCRWISAQRQRRCRRRAPRGSPRSARPGRPAAGRAAPPAPRPAAPPR